VTARGDYKGTLSRLTRSVDRGRILVAFYEDMIAGVAIDTICDFLGIGRYPARTDKVVHRGVALDMRPEQHAAARRFLAEQYDFVRAFMGRLPERWQSEPLGVKA